VVRTLETAKITLEPVAFFTRTDNFDEICTLFTFVISAALSASLSRIPVRYAALPFPDLRVRILGNGAGSRRMQMELGGMAV
jgi:hypothetical protein